MCGLVVCCCFWVCFVLFLFQNYLDWRVVRKLSLNWKSVGWPHIRLSFWSWRCRKQSSYGETWFEMYCLSNLENARLEVWFHYHEAAVQLLLSVETHLPTSTVNEGKSFLLLCSLHSCSKHSQFSELNEMWVLCQCCNEAMQLKPSLQCLNTSFINIFGSKCFSRHVKALLFGKGKRGNAAFVYVKSHWSPLLPP